MADWTARLAIEAITKGVDDANRQLDRLAVTAERVEERTNQAALGSQKMFRGLVLAGAAVAAALAAAKAVEWFVSMSDRAKLLTGQLRLVTEGARELAQAQRDLYALAQDTRTGLEGTISLYSRMARATDGLAISHERLLGVTRTVNQAIQVSGVTAQEAAAGTVQFAQALASGTLRGDELRSVLENMPRLARALKDGLAQQGLAGAAESASGALRRLAEEGKLTADVLIAALETQDGVIAREFGELPRTVGQAMTQLDNAILAAVSSIDGRSGLSDAVLRLADSLRTLAEDRGVIDFFTGLFTVIGWVVDVLRLLIETLGFFFQPRRRCRPGGSPTSSTAPTS